MARRDSIPPYELMRRGTASEPSTGSGKARSKPAQPSAEESGGSRDASPWWVGSTAPIVLRVPRGLLVGLVLGLVVLLMMAYWVGYSRGNANLQARLKQAVADHDQTAARGLRSPPGPVPGQDGSGGEGSPGSGESVGPGARAGSAGQATGDPRQKGINYMVLARYPPDAAQRLAAFLATQGVETYLDPVDNGKFVHVVAVGRGVKGGQRDSQAWRAFVKRLRAAGRAWKRSNGGRGDDLNTMYPDLYTGP